MIENVNMEIYYVIWIHKVTVLGITFLNRAGIIVFGYFIYSHGRHVYLFEL